MAPLVPYQVVELLTLVLAAGSAVVGLFIAALALRGVLRDRSRQMLFLSTGMILLFGAAYLTALVGSALVRFDVISLLHQNYVLLVVRALQFTGLLAIAYSLVIGE
ncbi:hypothetical protein G9C85_17355 [Halorubellus sp. JP-L1]|uniref:hypothetical protein n=1 Tax=Halorubellus sp. JP-L1 TaxID=2715753 RepID=UPI0014099235|nr:hypothetical protein [Halorubellus sp. JP-L1]NHN43387.1 hypothetical protein [Halorubellus sp. JP-L1]